MLIAYRSSVIIILVLYSSNSAHTNALNGSGPAPAGDYEAKCQRLKAWHERASWHSRHLGGRVIKHNTLHNKAKTTLGLTFEVLSLRIEIGGI